MAKYLVIVESPAKVKTVKKYLGANYEVAASMGHVRDLPKSRLGIDVEHDFEPKYITIRGKGDLQRDHKISSQSVDQTGTRHRYEPGGRAAGAPLPRPYGRL